MPTFSLHIDSTITKAWEATALGCIHYTLSVEEKNQTLWDFYTLSIETELQNKLHETDLVEMPNCKNARKAFKAFGIDPGRYRVSSEALYRRVRQGKPLYQINSLVDVNNVVSLLTGFSFGSYDMRYIGKDILFRLGTEGEEYTGIGKSIISLKNMPILSDKDGAFGSPISDATRGMITSTTQEALTVIYSFSGKEPLKETLELAEQFFTTYASITNISTHII